jgi:hypothetical protein
MTFKLRSRRWWAHVSVPCLAIAVNACGGSTEVTGSGGAGGSSSTNGTTTGNDATVVGAGGSGGVGGAGTGGNAGAGSDGGTCPLSEPKIGSPCTPAGRLNCFYGTNPCCGGAYTCGIDGTWQTLGLGCACMPPPDAGSDSRASDAQLDGLSDCGGATCGADQFCVHPSTNLCGPAPQCVPQNDAGACPAGTMFNSFCIGSPSGGCVAIPMRGPPHCATLSSTCGTSPSMCSCLPSNACAPGSADFCQRIDGRDVYCVCLAP